MERRVALRDGRRHLLARLGRHLRHQLGRRALRAPEARENPARREQRGGARAHRLGRRAEVDVDVLTLQAVPDPSRPVARRVNHLGAEPEQPGDRAQALGLDAEVHGARAAHLAGGFEQLAVVGVGRVHVGVPLLHVEGHRPADVPPLRLRVRQGTHARDDVHGGLRLELGDARHGGEPEAPADERAVLDVGQEAPEVKLQARLLRDPGDAREVILQVRVCAGACGDVVPGAEHDSVEAALGAVLERHDVTRDALDAAAVNVDRAVRDERVKLVGHHDASVQGRALGLHAVPRELAVLQAERRTRGEVAHPQRRVVAAAAEAQRLAEGAVPGEDPVHVAADGHRGAVRGARQVHRDLHRGRPAAKHQHVLAVEALGVVVLEECSVSKTPRRTAPTRRRRSLACRARRWRQ